MRTTSKRLSVGLAALFAIVFVGNAAASESFLSGWFGQTVDGNGSSPKTTNSVAYQGNEVIVFNGETHLFYSDYDAKTLRHAWSGNGSTWSHEVLDGSGGTNGRATFTSYVKGISGYAKGSELHVFYTVRVNNHGVLRQAWWDGTQWNFQTLDGLGGTAGETTANLDVEGIAAINTYGVKQEVFYFDADNYDLRHGWWDGSQWRYHTIDGHNNNFVYGTISADVGFGLCVAKQQYGTGAWDERVDVFYYDVTSGNLRHAWFYQVPGGSDAYFLFETLDGAGDVGRTCAAISDGYSMTVYYSISSSAGLRAARYNYFWDRWGFQTFSGGIVSGSFPSVLRMAPKTVDGTSQEVFYNFNDGLNAGIQHITLPRNAELPITSSGWSVENIVSRPNGEGTYDYCATRNSSSVLGLFCRDNAVADLRRFWR